MKKKITAWISQAVSIFSRSLTNIGKETSSTSTGVRAWSQIGDLLLGHATGISRPSGVESGSYERQIANTWSNLNGMRIIDQMISYLARISHRLSFCQSFESTAVCLELWLCSVEFNCRQLATQLTK
jgi:hypothetical protein